MSSVVISGDTSGAITLAAPAVSGTNTATLPAATGVVMVSGNMPAFSAYLSASQSITSGVLTKILIDTEIFDTNNNFASSRFTPTVAGYYQVNGAVANGSTTTATTVSINRNGTSVAQIATTASNSSSSASVLVYLNGSTDYVELYGALTGVSPQIYGTTNNQYTIFSASMVRTA